MPKTSRHPAAGPDRATPPDSHRLRPPTQYASRRAIGRWTVCALLKWIPVAVAQSVWWMFDDQHAGWRWTLASITAVLLVAQAIVEPQWRYRVHRWEVTATAAYTQAGWFTQERRIAPLSRVQTVDLQQGPLQQLFRLAEVTITTASAAGPLTIAGLDRGIAQRLVRDVTAAAEVAADDAT